MATRSETSAPAQRHHHFILTLFGLYAREFGDVLAVADIVRMMSELGVEEAGVRSSISRLKRRGVLESTKRASAAAYRLPSHLHRVFSAGDARIFQPHRAEAGDPWVLASFSVPEQQRHIRHRLRSTLIRLGCGQVSPGLWIAPGTITSELQSAIAAADVGDFVELFEAHHLTAEHAAHAVRRWWDLDMLATLYDDFLERFTPLLTDAGGERGPAEAFRSYVPLVTEWRRLAYRDPGLALEYLPRDWSGARAETLFLDAHDALSDSARRFAHSVIAK